MIALKQKNEKVKNALPLFPNLPQLGSFARSQKIMFSDPFLLELIESRPLQRLKKIGFLGAIDYVVASPNGPQPHRRRHNRFEHSLGVANLALLYCRTRQLNEKETRLLVAAALLHDIGHAPLSHSLESVFKLHFGISHHVVGRDILYGRENIGRHLPKIMQHYGVEIDEIEAMIAGTHGGEHAFLFSGPINLDTIEGINRSKAFFSRFGEPLNPHKLVKAMATNKVPPLESMDAFWLLKNEVYKFFIHHPAKIIFDALAQAYCDINIRRFSRLDFLKSEDELRFDHPNLFKLFDMRYASDIETNILNYQLEIPNRSFVINYDVKVKNVLDLPLRYQQTKSGRLIKISQLVRN